MVRKKKWESAEEADILSEFCRVDPSTLTYGQYVGLRLNASRRSNGRVLEFLRALCYSRNNVDLPSSLFETVASSSEQAADIAFDVNAQRRLSRMMAEGTS